MINIKERSIAYSSSVDEYLAEPVVLSCRVPRVLKVVCQIAADAEGILLSEYIRQAIYLRIGWDDDDKRLKLTEAVLDIVKTRGV